MVTKVRVTTSSSTRYKDITHKTDIGTSVRIVTPDPWMATGVDAGGTGSLKIKSNEYCCYFPLCLIKFENHCSAVVLKSVYACARA